MRNVLMNKIRINPKLRVSGGIPLTILFLFLEFTPQTLVVPSFRHTFGFYRASKYYLQLFLGANFECNNPQGITAVKLKELNDPKTKRDDDELTIFAVNSGRGQVVYNIGLEEVKVYGDDKIFSNPKGITANENGLIALADFGNSRVVKLQYHKGAIDKVAEIPMTGRPYDVCLDSKNNLYVTDYDNSRVLVYSPSDSLIFEFGKKGRAFGEIYHPMGIEVIDASAPHNHYQDDFIVITDKNGMRISKFTTKGRFLGSVESFELGLTDANFLYIAIDYFGSIYVTDEVNDQIHKFDHNLRYIISVGRPGTDKGEFFSPRGITIWRRYGQVFIAEKEGGQYLWIGVDGFVVGCFPKEFNQSQPGTTLAIYTTEETKIDITIHNQSGEKIRDLIKGIRRIPGEFLVVWDGRDNSNAFVKQGDYRFHITLKSLHGHSKRIKKNLKASVRFITS